MAIVMGSASNPVQIGPLQAIVDVGWSVYTHLDVSVVLNFRRTDGTLIDIGCTPYDTVTEGIDYTSESLVSAGYEFPTGFTASIRGRKSNGTWVGLDPANVTVEGLPTLPVDYAAAAWSWPIGQPTRFSDPTSTPDGPVYLLSPGALYQAPTMIWVPPTGSNTDIEFTEGVFYKDSLDAHVATKSDPFSGGPACVGGVGGLGSYRFAPIDVCNPQIFNTFSPVTAMSATHAGKTYTAVGSHLRQTGLVREYTLFTLLAKTD